MPDLPQTTSLELYSGQALSEIEGEHRWHREINRKSSMSRPFTFCLFTFTFLLLTY